MQQDEKSPQPGPSGPGIGPRQRSFGAPHNNARVDEAQPIEPRLLEGNVSDVDERPIRINDTNFESKGTVINLVYQTKYKPGVISNRMRTIEEVAEKNENANGNSPPAEKNEKQPPLLDLGFNFSQALGIAPEGSPGANGRSNPNRKNIKVKSTMYSGYDSPEFMSRKNSVELSDSAKNMIREFLKLPSVYPLLVNKEIQLAVHTEMTTLPPAAPEQKSHFAPSSVNL